MQDTYTSEVRILPVDNKPSGGGLGNLAAAAAAFGLSIPGGDGSDANFTDILASRWLREKLLKTEFQFQARTWRFGPEENRKESLIAFLKARTIDGGLRRLRPMLTVARDQRSKLLTIDCDSISPGLSQKVVQRSTELLEEFVKRHTRTHGSAKAAFAEARLTDARSELAQAENELRLFLDGNRNYTTSSDPSVRIKGARLELELKLRQQLLTTIALSHEQALMDEKNDIPILNILDSGNLPTEKSGPSRSRMVLMAFLLSSMVAWIWSNRDWIPRWLLDRDPPAHGPGLSGKEEGVQ